MDAMKAAGSQVRGVAVVDPLISNEELEEMHTAGVRGLRVNVVDVKNRTATGRLGYRLASCHG